MDVKKVIPWNWFKHEENSDSRPLPVHRQGSRQYNAYDTLVAMHQEIDRIFDDVLRNAGSPPWALSAVLSAESNIFTPSVDIGGDEKEYRITVEVPGIDEKDVVLDLTRDGMLTIKGEKRQEQQEKERDSYRVERSYGAFQRVLALPQDIDHEQIEASFRKGVLTIRLPRKPAAPSDVRRIGIEAEKVGQTTEEDRD
jgi:HSP20 family protein